MSVRVVAGIDLGGTKILGGVFSEEGALLGERLISTCASRGLAGVLDRLKWVLDDLMDELGQGHALAGVVVAFPGPLDHRRGFVYEAPNLGWKGVSLRDELQKFWGVPVWVENDGNLAALGEYVFGYPEKYRIMLYLTVSTGIGGGLIIDGEIYRGANGGACEFGHMTILPEGGPRCGCGNYGCLEALASGTAIGRVARQEVARGGCRAVGLAVDGCGDQIDARLVCEVSDAGDESASFILDEAFNYLGIGAANLVNLFNPEAVIIGGGLAGNRRLLPMVQEVVRRRAYTSSTVNLDILPARLGARAGLMGCLAYALMVRSEETGERGDGRTGGRGDGGRKTQIDAD